MKTQTDLIFRVPQFSFDAKLSDKWDKLKQSISLSSDSFYQLIKNLQFDELAILSQRLGCPCYVDDIAKQLFIHQLPIHTDIQYGFVVLNGPKGNLRLQRIDHRMVKPKAITYHK